MNPLCCKVVTNITPKGVAPPRAHVKSVKSVIEKQVSPPEQGPKNRFHRTAHDPSSWWPGDPLITDLFEDLVEVWEPSNDGIEETDHALCLIELALFKREENALLDACDLIRDVDEEGSGKAIMILRSLATKGIDKRRKAFFKRLTETYLTDHEMESHDEPDIIEIEDGPDAT